MNFNTHKRIGKIIRYTIQDITDSGISFRDSDGKELHRHDIINDVFNEIITLDDYEDMQVHQIAFFTLDHLRAIEIVDFDEVIELLVKVTKDCKPIKDKDGRFMQLVFDEVES